MYGQLLVNTNAATFIFIDKLGFKKIPGQFWPCLSFSALNHDSNSPSLDFWSCGPKLRLLNIIVFFSIGSEIELTVEFNSKILFTSTPFYFRT